MGKKRKNKSGPSSSSVVGGAVNAIKSWKGRRAGSTSWHWKPGSRKVSEKKIQELLQTQISSKSDGNKGTTLVLKKCPFCGVDLSPGSRLSGHLDESERCMQQIVRQTEEGQNRSK